MNGNIHRVNKKQWKKFGLAGQRVFNETWRQLPRYNLTRTLCGVDSSRRLDRVLRFNICFEAALAARQVFQGAQIVWKN